MVIASRPPTRAEFRQLLAQSPVTRETGPTAPIQLTCQDLIGWRMRMRMPQAELAERMGIDASTVKRWEHADRPIPPYLSLVLDRIEFDLAG